MAARSFEQCLSRLAVYLCLSNGNPRSGRRFRSWAGNFLYDYASSFYSWERKAEAKASSYRKILHFRDPETGDTGTDHSDEPAGTPFFCYNLIVIRYLGNIGVSAFSVVCYLLTLVFSVFIGVSDGIQPLISRSAGEGKKELERRFPKKGIAVNFLLAFLLYAVLLFVWRTGHSHL